MMKILMIKNHLGVKQYHLACALTDAYGYRCHFMKEIPKPNLKSILHKIRNHLTGTPPKNPFMEQKYHLNPFISTNYFTTEKILRLTPDIIYVSSVKLDHALIDILAKLKIPIVLDIEDSALLDKKGMPNTQNEKRVKKEQKLISHKSIKALLWGSNTESELAEKTYNQAKPHLTVYPYVAKRTLPKIHNKGPRNPKRSVYIGSIWAKSQYRDYYHKIEEICEFGYDLTVYLLNSNNLLNWNILKKLESKNPTLHARKYIPYDRVKQTITEYEVGLVFSNPTHPKYQATYGMKPLEYAYANVQPASFGLPIKNHSDGEQYSYSYTPKTLYENYEYNLRKFDWNFHLMDNRIHKLNQLLKETAQ